MPDSDIHSQIEHERTTALPDAEQVREFRAYTRGHQRATLTAKQERILRGVLGHTFCDNVCRMVVHQISSRLRLIRYDVASTAVEQYLSTLWTLNHLPTLSAMVHWALFRDGNTALGLRWDGDRNGRALVSRERWWNGATGMFVAYDDRGQVAYAVNEWKVKETALRTVYRPQQIERYQLDASSKDGWKPRRLESDPDWPVPWLDRSGAPLGIPVVHIANVALPNDEDADDGTPKGSPRYGVSVLDGGVLGLQDEVNDVHRDITAAGRFTAYQMTYGTGVSPQTDEEGKPAPTYRPEPGAHFEEPNPQAAFGVLPAGSLAELERQLTVKLQAVSRMTSVPIHLIAGQWPSGEAIFRAEQPLVELVETSAAAVGPAWASVGHKATRLANTFGGQALDEDALIGAVFAPVARRDPLMLAQIAAAEAPYVSLQEVLRRLGKSPAEIKRILDERADEAARGIAPPSIPQPAAPQERERALPAS